MFEDYSKFKVLTLKDINYWINDFESIRLEILDSNDAKKINYSKDNFILEEQEEISVIYHNNKLVSFSTIFKGPNKGNFKYPKGVYRVLNRSWKSPKIRWRKPAYHILSQLMLEPQIIKAKELNANAVFISSEGHRKRWLKSWILGANTDYTNWTQIEGMVQVCGGSYLKCWQNVGYLALQDNYIPNFEKITYEEWDEYTKN